jgi:hypothetical protein
LLGLGSQPLITAAVQAEIPGGGHGRPDWKAAINWVPADGRQGFVSKLVL